MESINKSILSKVYKQQETLSLVSRQIDSIHYDQIESHSQSIFIHLSLPPKTQKYHFQFSEPIKFIIQIGKGFPVYPPKIYLCSPITTIKINDFRNLLPFLVQEWSYQISLSKCVDLLSDLLMKLSKMDNLQLQKIGRFQIDKLYTFKFLNMFPTEYFYAFECNEDEITLYVVVLSQTHFLLMKSIKQPYFDGDKLKVPNPEQINEMVLIFGCQLQAISEILIDNTNFIECKFRFQCFNQGKDFCERITREKLFKIGKCKQLLTKIFKSLSKFHSKLQIQTPYQTPQQQQLMKQLKAKEIKYKKSKTKQDLQKLIQGYRQCVEYYSANLSPYYLIYMSKIQNLFFNQLIV